MNGKVIQISVTSENESSYPRITVLTDTGEVYTAPLTPEVSKGDRMPEWTRISTDLG